MMNNAANSAMMAPGVMMDMSGMMGAMGAMGMNSDMAAMGGPMMQNMMPPDGNTQGGQQAVVGPGGAGAAPDQVAMLQDGAFNTPSVATGPGMMHMGMGGDFVMQVIIVCFWFL
jgi:pre-mRNA 3'-end-processing factor FIP1